MRTANAKSAPSRLSDEFTGATLKDFIERYVRLGLITSMDDTDEILNLAWTPIL